MEFLFENPFILILLIGLISSLFKKGKGEEQQPRQRPPKPFVETIPIPESKIPQKSEKVETEKRTKESVKTIQSDFLDAKKQAEAKMAALREQQLKYEHQAERLKEENELKQPTPTETAVKKSYRVEEKNLADAIIWAEILGPPRAKNPHRARNWK